MIKKIIYKIWLSGREYVFRRKIKGISRMLRPGRLPRDIENDYLLRWRWTGKSRSLLYPRVYSMISGKVSSLYVPENVYYNRIEPVLNDRAYAHAYADKNFYEKYLREFRHLFPETVLRYINGVFYNSDYQPVDLQRGAFSLLEEVSGYIIKPAVETGGGSGLAVVERYRDDIIINGNKIHVKDLDVVLKKLYPLSFVLQKRIIQYPWFEAFNKASVNTVRMFSYRSVKDNTVEILQSVIRFGREGSIVDNQAAGGLSCGVDSSGVINDFAIDKKGHRYTGIKYLDEIKNSRVPGYDEMKKIVMKVAPEYPYHRLLGFDLCMDINGNIRILEINCKNIETNFLQMNNGPLFGARTEEISDYCAKNKLSVVFDFRI